MNKLHASRAIREQNDKVSIFGGGQRSDRQVSIFGGEIIGIVTSDYGPTKPRANKISRFNKATWIWVDALLVPKLILFFDN